MPKEPKPIRNLNLEITLVQAKDLVEGLDKTVKKELKKALKKTLISVGPLFIGVALTLITKTPWFVIGGGSFSVVFTIVDQIKVMLNDSKNIWSTKEVKSSKIINLHPKEEDIDNIFQKPKEISDFQTELLKSINAQKMPIDIQKKPHLQLVDRSFLNKEETIKQINEEIEVYSLAYKLPPFKISNKDLDLFFDTLYKNFESRGLEATFYDTSSELIRLVLSKSLVSNMKTINLDFLIKNIDYLEMFDFNKKEILKIQKEILLSLGTSKIININDIRSQNNKQR